MSIRATAALLALLVTSPVAAQAPVVKVSCELYEISATTGKEASVDAALKPLEKKLKKLPFSYNTYKVLSKASKSLEKGKTEALTLAKGSATLTLVETVDKTKVRYTLTEDHAGKRVVNTTQTIAAGDWSVTGHPVKDEGHLLAVSCR